MGQITSGVGLISGLPTADIIDQLMALESKPMLLIQKRNLQLQNQQSALKDINSRLLSLKLAAGKLTLPTTFGQTAAVSSDESILSVTSGPGSTEGTFSFLVHQLVSSQQTITRGFADADATPIAPAGGVLTFARGQARLDTTTRLSDLNGGEGIRRGVIRVTDRSGASAVIDLSAVATVNDVIDAINNTSGISVFAQASGDGFTLTDLTGQSASNLVVADVGTSRTATSLGLVGSVAGDTLTGAAVNTLGRSTLLSSLNDGNGVHNRQGLADLRISAGGVDYDIDLDGFTTVGQVFDQIAAVTGGAVTADVTADGVGLQLTGPAGFTVAALNDSTAAEDLGLLGTADGSGVLGGGRLLAGLNSKLLRNLNGGQGVDAGTISITNRAGAQTQIDLSTASSVDDLVRLINDSGAGVTASLNAAGNGLLLTDASGGAGSLTIADVSGSAAANLNLAGSHTGATADSGDLRFRYVTQGTRLDQLGVARGQFRITDSAGVSATVDLTQGDEQSIGDVIAEINSRGLKITARVNDDGDGILIEDTGPGVVAMTIEDQGSTTASDLGIAGQAAAAGDDINGSFQRTVTIEATDTLTDVARKIVEAKVGVAAAVINDGSAGAPYRLSLSALDPGARGAFVFDDGGLGLGATELSEARDAVVFYGSSDPAKALVVTSRTNQLERVIPGATIDLKATSDKPVQVTISRDDNAAVEAIAGFVEAFNAVTTRIDELDSYDVETQERGILLGDSSVAIVRQRLFSTIIRRNADLTSRYDSLAEVGITVGSDSKIEFNEAKFRAAIETDQDAVKAVFTFRQTQEGDDGVKTTVARGIGVAIDEMLGNLTDPQFGPVESRVDTLDAQIRQNESRIEDFNERLEQKRLALEQQFTAMEKVLAEMQKQSAALGGLSQILANMKK